MNRPSTSFQIHCVSIAVFLGICVSALSFNQFNSKSCQVSLDNSGYIMNSPVDVQNQQENASR